MTRSCTKHRSRLSSTTSWTLLLWMPSSCTKNMAETGEVPLHQKAFRETLALELAERGLPPQLNLGHFLPVITNLCTYQDTAQLGAWGADTARPRLLWSVPHVMCTCALCQVETATMIGMLPTANNVNTNCEYCSVLFAMSLFMYIN